MKIKFLVIRFSSIGDIVLTSPVVRGLKKQVENAEIHFAVKEKYRCFLDSNPFIDHIHVLNNNISDLIAELKAEEFDYVIDLHQNFRSNRIKSSLNIPSFTFEKLNAQKFLLVNLKINRLPDIHIVDRYMAAVSVFDVKNDGNGLDFFIDKEYNRENLPLVFRGKYIAFVLAGTYHTKKLPPEKVIKICNSIEHPVVLLGGKNEVETGDKICSKTNGHVLNLAGKLNLHESATFIRDASIVLTNDTGLMHIAAAFKKKILSFWGNTVPEFGMVPYQPHSDSKILEVENLKCRPCSKLGYRECPKKHFKCMKDIDVGEAVAWIKQNF